MNKTRSLIICRCQAYHRVDDEKLAGLVSAAQVAGISLRLMDDLCYEAARHPEKLRDAEAIAGCRRRTLLSLCIYAGGDKLPLVFDLNNSVDEIIQSLDKGNDSSRKQESYDQLPNDWVAWYPVIDPSRCVHCKKCVDFCMFGVYAVEDDKVKVVHPAACKTNCPACARMCPANAIIFPKSEEPAINGSLTSVMKPDMEKGNSLRARLKERKSVRLFKEDEE